MQKNTPMLVIMSGSNAMYDLGDEVMYDSLSWKIYSVNKSPVQYKYALIRKTEKGHTLIRHNVPQSEIWSWGKRFIGLELGSGEE